MAPRKPEELKADEQPDFSQALTELEERLGRRMDTVSGNIVHLTGSLEGFLEAFFDTKTSKSDRSLPPVTRRRTQDEMQAALKRLLSDMPRPRDDDSPQVIEDAFNEVLWLRQLSQDLMQTLTGGYQQGLASIRKMTEK